MSEIVIRKKYVMMGADYSQIFVGCSKTGLIQGTPIIGQSWAKIFYPEKSDFSA